MNTNLQFYVKKVPNFLDKQFCNEVIQNIQSLNWRQHHFSKYTKETETLTSAPLSGEQELDITYVDTKNSKYLDIIMEKLWQEIKNYLIYYNFNWFVNWTGYSQVRFNRYEKTKKMAEHCDHIHSLFDGKIKGIPTLSLLGSLNDNYKGGEFIMFQNKKITLKQGELLIFPSNFLYPHRVEPVTKGVRYSYISWVY